MSIWNKVNRERMLQNMNDKSAQGFIPLIENRIEFIKAFKHCDPSSKTYVKEVLQQFASSIDMDYGGVCMFFMNNNMTRLIMSALKKAKMSDPDVSVADVSDRIQKAWANANSMRTPYQIEHFDQAQDKPKIKSKISSAKDQKAKAKTKNKPFKVEHKPLAKKDTQSNIAIGVAVATGLI